MAIKTFCTRNRFVFLLFAPAIVLLGYPYLPDTRLGAFLGGMISLILMVASVYTVWGRKWVFVVACGLMLITATLSILSLVAGTRGNPLVEGNLGVLYVAVLISRIVGIYSSKQDI